jgi:hypothetical protein
MITEQKRRLSTAFKNAIDQTGKRIDEITGCIDLDEAF